MLKKEIQIANILVFVTLLISGLVLIFGFTGCAVKVFPIRNTDAQVEMLRRVAIESYKNGMYDVLEALEEEESTEPELLPWSDELEVIPLPDAKSKEKIKL